jgi:glycerol uptake facilitator-like aquaporin
MKLLCAFYICVGMRYVTDGMMNPAYWVGLIIPTWLVLLMYSEWRASVHRERAERYYWQQRKKHDESRELVRR